MQTFPFLSQHQDQAKRLFRQRLSARKGFQVSAASLQSIEQRMRMHWYACAQTDERCDDPIINDAITLYRSRFDSKVCRSWLIEQLEQDDADPESLYQLVAVIADKMTSLEIEPLLESYPQHRAFLLRLANCLNLTLSRECIHRSEQSPHSEERCLALQYAKTRAEFPLTNFQAYKTQPQLLSRPNEFAAILLAALLRRDPDVTERVIQFISRMQLEPGQYPLLRVAALTGEDKVVPILSQYSHADPEQGTWLLALHGKVSAIEALIELMVQPAVALHAQIAWYGVTGQTLPIDLNAQKVHLVKSHTVQTPYEANQQAAKKWWYQHKAEWPIEQAMWQGLAKTSAWLHQCVLLWRGAISDDLVDMLRLTSGQLLPVSTDLSVERFDRQLAHWLES